MSEKNGLKSQEFNLKLLLLLENVYFIVIYIKFYETQLKKKLKELTLQNFVLCTTKLMPVFFTLPADIQIFLSLF